MKFFLGFNPFTQFRPQRGLQAILLAIATLGVILIQPAPAFQVHMMPPSPQLGILYQCRCNSQLLTLRQHLLFSTMVKPIRCLLWGANQYRALLPTTPLDQPGTKQIQVINGSQQQTISLSLRDRNFPTQSIWLPRIKKT
jgi:hypothetical protein